MTKIFATLTITLTTCLAMAAEVIPPTPQQRGVNEKVTIQSLRTNWGFTKQMTGFYQGTARYDIVPVTREAALVLKSLNRQSQYNCVIENSTFVPQSRDQEIVGGTYFVLDINCN